MKRIAAVITLMLILSRCFIVETSAEGFVRDMTPARSKIISVVYDNSTSMIKDDGRDGYYSTRWIEADYAVKALASMMNEGDIFRLYIMGDNQSEGKKLNKMEISRDGRMRAGKSQEVETIESWMKDMDHINATWFSGVEYARADFSETDCAEKDCWIVILTDGQFTHPVKLDEEKLRSSFDQLTNEKKVSLAYIPIGGNGAIDINSDPQNGIIVPDEKEDITKQITEVANIIYQRVQMGEGISSKYMSIEDGKIIIKPNIPLEKTIVFVQYRGDALLYSDYERQVAADKTVSMDIVASEESVENPRYMNLVSENAFSGRTDKPKWRTKENLEEAKVKYRPLKGVILTWAGNLDQFNTVSIEDNGEEQKISIPVNKGQKLTSEVYYQPAVNVSFEYWQNGKNVEHAEECLFQKGEMQYEEYCIQEGDLAVELKFVDSKGKTLTNSDSELLYLENFKVTLYPDNEEGNKIEFWPTDNKYCYKGQVEQGSYEMVITTSWHQELKQHINVQEKQKELKVSCSAPDRIMIDDLTGEGSKIKVTVKEDGLIPDEDTLKRIIVTCDSENSALQIEELGREENGTWVFRVGLKDPEGYQISGNGKFNIKAVRSYDHGKPKEDSAVLTRSLGSGPHVLSAEAQSTQPVDALHMLGKDMTVQYVYRCDEKVLTEDSRENLKVSLIMPSDGDFGDLITLGDKDFNLYLKKSLKWYGIDQEYIKGTIHVSYHIYGSDLGEDFEVQIPFKPVPRGIKNMVTIVMVIVILWLLLIIAKLFTPWHIKKMKPYLRAEKGRRDFNLDFKRLGNLFVPWCRTASMTRRASNVAEPYLPDIKIKIRNNLEGDGWVICNYEECVDGDKFRIGDSAISDSAISEDNHIFSSDKKFFVISKDGKKQELRFKN